MTNVELLERTMQHILDHPESHDQRVYVNECGTAACFAGWAVILSGEQIGLEVFWDAARLLGLTKIEAMCLFNGLNSRTMLELMVKDLINGDELRRPYEYRNEATLTYEYRNEAMLS